MTTASCSSFGYWNNRVALIVFIFLTEILAVVSSLTAFDVRSMCNMMIPFEAAATSAVKDDPSPFEIKVSNQFGINVREYEPGKNKTVQVVVRGHRSFKGLILQARLISDGLTRVGSCLDPVPEGARVLHCDGHQSRSSVWFHSGHLLTHRLKFTWSLPDIDQGPIRFRASILDNDSTLWTNVESPVIFSVDQPPEIFETPLKSSGLFSCHSVNENRRCFTGMCRGFDLICKFSINWKCYGGQVLYRFKTVRFRRKNHRVQTLENQHSSQHPGIYIGLALSDRKLSALYDRLVLCEWLNKSGDTKRDENGRMMLAKFRTYLIHPAIGYPVPYRDDSVENIDVTSTSRDFGCKIIRKENRQKGEYLSFVWGFMNEDGYPEKPNPAHRILVNESMSDHCAIVPNAQKLQKSTNCAKRLPICAFFLYILYLFCIRV